MYAVEAYFKDKRWISGIFKDKDQLDNYMNSIPDELRNLQNIIKLPFTDYPFYIIELQGYKYLNKNDFLSYLDNYQYDNKDDESVFFNIYLIDSDYKPNKPGTDYMGILHHDHITTRFFEFYKKEREGFLRRNRFL